MSGKRFSPLPGLSIGQQTADFFHITGFDHLHLPQAPFTLGALLSQNMAVMRFGKGEFAASGFAEPFGGGSVCLDFSHFSLRFRAWRDSRDGLYSSRYFDKKNRKVRAHNYLSAHPVTACGCSKDRFFSSNSPQLALIWATVP